MVSRPLFTKDPDETLDFSISYADELEGLSDTITSSEWEVPAGITEESSSFTADEAVIFISGGTAGQTYELFNTVTTNNSEPRIFKRAAVLKIVEN